MDQAEQFREYLNRGGFLMVDDFHGDQPWEGNNEWEVSPPASRKCYPICPVEEIPNNDPIFHTLFDLDERFQVPGSPIFPDRHTYEKGESGKVPHWRCIRDDKGRIVVAICHNMDLGDAWEYSDDPGIWKSGRRWRSGSR